MPVKVHLDQVGMAFTTPGGTFRAVEPLDLSIETGRFVSLVGPSGCGKSTLFNIIAGLLQPTEGRVLIDGEDATGTIGRVGYMLQKDLLLPWRTVLDNVILGMEIQGKPLREARERALPLLQQYGLAGFEYLYPNSLSGGMRQRAALLRTLLFDTDVILLDEPFGALDAQTKLQMQEWLMQLWSDFTKTVVFVTHDVEEAIYLSDEIHVMGTRPGRILETHPDRAAAAARAHQHADAGFHRHQGALPRPARTSPRRAERPPDMAHPGHPPRRRRCPASTNRTARAATRGPRRSRRAACRCRRTGRLWAIIAAQIGILVGIIALWEIGARAGWIDAFFWSQPSAICEHVHDLLHRRRRLDRHQLHLPLDHPGLPHRHHRGLAARPVVLVVAQLRGDRAALHHLLRIDAEARARAAHHPGVRHRA